MLDDLRDIILLDQKMMVVVTPLCEELDPRAQRTRREFTHMVLLPVIHPPVLPVVVSRGRLCRIDCGQASLNMVSSRLVVQMEHVNVLRESLLTSQGHSADGTSQLTRNAVVSKPESFIPAAGTFLLRVTKDMG